MPHYHIWRKDDELADSYWVYAESPSAARRLVALNVLAAASAEDETKFLCEISFDKMPPTPLIYRRLYGPITITKEDFGGMELGAMTSDLDVVRTANILVKEYGPSMRR
jgi:hypothetical protein